MRLRGHPMIDGRTPQVPSIEVNPYFNQINHDKGSITVNLKDARGQALLYRLIPLTDVVIENLTPGALSKSGFGYDTLSKLNPRLVMMSMSSTGQPGPLNNFRAYAPIMSSHCGLERLVGYPGESPIGMMNFLRRPERGRPGPAAAAGRAARTRGERSRLLHRHVANRGGGLGARRGDPPMDDERRAVRAGGQPPSLDGAARHLPRRR